MHARGFVSVIFVGVLAGSLGSARGDDGALAPQARDAMMRASTFFRNQVARHGGYAYYASLDSTERWGEGRVSADTILVEPPGTPTVGMAYLDAFEATSETFYRDAAIDAGRALVYGQLVSGGWTQVIDFGPTGGRRQGKYRNGKGGDWDASSLDDDQSQAALRFLFRLDRVLGLADGEIHKAASFGLNALLKAQFANGAFPQVWRGPVEARPIVAARYPEYDWRTEGRVKEYWNAYTLNDNLAGDVVETLIAAHEAYGDERAKAALAKLGDFLILARMPEPQPGWCQQYGDAMTPIWARKFEPPAITGSESQNVMKALIRIAGYTGDEKYLEPIPRALEYFRASLLPDGRLARYYELKTNRPLFMDAAYQLTYDDKDAPSHYGWKVTSQLDSIERAYESASRGDAPATRRRSSADEARVRRILDDLDGEGRWVSTYDDRRLEGQPKFESGAKFLASRVFAENLEALSAFVAGRRQ